MTPIEDIHKAIEDHSDRNPKGRLLFMGLLLCGIVAGLFFLPVKAYLLALLEWTRDLGTWAPVAVIVIYIAACVLFLPGSVITLGAGLIFGVVKGTIVVSLGSVLGALAAFFVGRTFLRKWIEKKVAQNPKFLAIDQAVGQQGFKIVLLTRLSPVIPFNLLNYAFGLTRVSAPHYFFGSWIGMLPATVMYVYFGSALRSLTEVAAGDIQGGAAQQYFFWIGLAATMAVVVIITRIATAAFKKAVARPETTANEK